MAKLSRSEIVKKAWEKRRETFIPPMKGKTMSDESRAKMSAAAKARPSNRLGAKHTEETRAKISAKTREKTPRGKDAPGFIDGRGVERNGARASDAYKRWRYDCMSRDGFMCMHCGDDRGGNLQVHHILPFSDHPSRRIDTRNGVTLCETCHHMFHVYGLDLFAPMQ